MNPYSPTLRVMARALLGVCLLILAACSRVSERFENVRAAQKAGFFERGWLPEVLPREAGPIQAVQDLDTNAHCSRSELPVVSVPEVQEALLEQGFTPHDGPPPKLPFSGCPFEFSSVVNAKLILTRVTELQVEHAAVVESPAALLFWAAHSERFERHR